MASSSGWIMSGTAHASRAPRPPSPVYIDLTEPPAWTLEPKIPTLHPKLGLPIMEKAGLKLYWEIIGVENPERMDPHPSLLLSQFELQLIDAPRLGAPPPPPQSPQPEPSEKAKGKARAEPPRPAARLRLVAHRPEDNYEIPKSTLAPLANYSPASQSNLPASQSNLSTSQSNLPTGQNNLTTSQSSSSSSRSNLPTSQTPAKRPGVAQPVTRPQKSRRYQKTQSGPAPGPKPESLASKAAHNSIRQRLEREKVPQIARDSPSPEPQDTIYVIPA